MAKSHTTRFASFDADGDIVSLVAEGLPEWPAEGNLEAIVDDADLGTLHDAYLARRDEIVAANTADPASVTDEMADEAVQLAERIPALRTEAARRIELAATTTEPPADPTDPADAPAGGLSAERLAALAALDEAPTDPPAPAPARAPGDPVVVPVGPTAEQMATATATALGEILPTFATSVAEAFAARMPAEPRRPVTVATLGTYRPDDRDPALGTDVAITGAPRGRLVHRGDVPGLPLGYEFSTMDSLVDAMIVRHRDIGSTAGDEQKVQVASYVQPDPSPTRDLRNLDGDTQRQRIRDAVGPKAMGVDPWNLERELPIGKGGMIVDDAEALVASGGLAAPVAPYYPQLVIAQSGRPFIDSMASFVAERGGIRLVLPPSLATLAAATTVGQFTDGVTNTDTSFVSATAAFVATDVNQPIIGAGIPAGTTIASRTNGTTVVLSAATTATATGVTFRLPSRNPSNLGNAVGLVTAAQDAAGPPATVKFTYDVPIGTQAEFDVYSVYTSLQFANLTARTFPEQVEANIRLAAALADRVAEQQAMNIVTNWSTLFTGAKTFGTARQLLAQFEHMAAYYRNTQRMDPEAVLRLNIPAWAINAMRADYLSSFIGGADNWGLSDDEINGWFENEHILPSFYWDGPTDVNQIFPTAGSGATNTGTNSATPVAIPDYPGTGSSTSFRTNVVSFMWAEGTWLGLTTGEMNLGLVRDSILNSQNRFRNFTEEWMTPAFVGTLSLRGVHTVASDGTYGAAATITLGAGSGL